MSERKYVNSIVLENARISGKNFEGREVRSQKTGDVVNAKGNRTFTVDIPADKAEKLINEGWNIKKRFSENPDAEPRYYIPVSVSFDNYPPKISLVDGDNHKVVRVFDERNIGELDYLDIQYVDIQIRPYMWSVRGNQGIKAYVKMMYAVEAPNVFSTKYDFDESFEEDGLNIKSDKLPF